MAQAEIGGLSATESRQASQIRTVRLAEAAQL
jgi:hypothetical protein